MTNDPRLGGEHDDQKMSKSYRGGIGFVSDSFGWPERVRGDFQGSNYYHPPCSYPARRVTNGNLLYVTPSRLWSRTTASRRITRITSTCQIWNRADPSSP